MTKLYDKEVITELEVDLFDRDYKIIVLDNEKQNAYDIHIITDRYAKDEINTLFLQESKEYTYVKKFDTLYLTRTVVEFALWDEFCGYRGKSYTFSVDITDECKL